jgi:coenzyme PQQ precursor peptide PqqA
MTWKTPKIVQVQVGIEINMCACASSKQLANARVQTGGITRPHSTNPDR